MIEEIEVSPVITKQEDLDAIENKFPDQRPSRIFTDSVKITCGGKLKALFLKPKDNKAPIPESHYKPALNVLHGAWMKEFDVNEEGKLISGTGHGRVFVNKLPWRPSGTSVARW